MRSSTASCGSAARTSSGRTGRCGSTTTGGPPPAARRSPTRSRGRRTCTPWPRWPVCRSPARSPTPCWTDCCAARCTTTSTAAGTTRPPTAATGTAATRPSGTDRLRPRVRAARRRDSRGGGAPGRPGAAGRGAGGARAVRRAGHRPGGRRLRPHLVAPRALPRAQRDHAHRGGAARRRRRHGRPGAPRTGAAPGHGHGRAVRPGARVAAGRALHPGLGAPARAPPRPAGRPVPPVRRHRRPRPGVVAAAPRPGRGRRAGGRTRARVARPGGGGPLRPRGHRRLGGRRRGGVRLHDRLVGRRWCTTACTGWWPRRWWRPPRCTR